MGDKSAVFSLKIHSCRLKQHRSIRKVSHTVCTEGVIFGLARRKGDAQNPDSRGNIGSRAKSVESSENVEGNLIR